MLRGLAFYILIPLTTQNGNIIISESLSSATETGKITGWRCLEQTNNERG